MQQYAIIVAGGSGSRMGADIPKQFLKIGGKPILMHTLQAWHKAYAATELILVLPASEIGQWEKLCEEYKFTVKHSVVAGGDTRYQSVKNGLATINTPDSLIAIHDGVRPFITKEIITAAYNTAATKGSAIVCVPLKDSIRKKSGNTSVAEDRSQFYLVQTPQTFRFDVIKTAFSKVNYDNTITDDASVAEKAGFSITMVEGDYKNIKITTPEDLLVAEAYLSSGLYS